MVPLSRTEPCPWEPTRIRQSALPVRSVRAVATHVTDTDSPGARFGSRRCGARIVGKISRESPSRMATTAVSPVAVSLDGLVMVAVSSALPPARMRVGAETLSSMSCLSYLDSSSMSWSALSASW